MGDPTLTDADLYGPSGRPEPTDIHQRDLGDCYFLAPLGSLAHQQPGRIQDAITYDTASENFNVTLYQHGHGGFLGLQSEAKPVHVQVSQADVRADIRLSDNLIEPHGAKHSPIWPAVMEAAYADLAKKKDETIDQGLDGIGHGGYPKSAMYALTGETSSRISGHEAKGLPLDKVYDRIYGALDEGRPVVLNTNYMSSVPTDGLIKGDGGSGHAYMVEGISKDPQGNVAVTVRNPWGMNVSHGLGIESPDPLVKVDLKTALGNGHVDDLEFGPKPPVRTQDKEAKPEQGQDPAAKEHAAAVRTGDPAMDRLLASLNDPQAMGHALTALAQSLDGQAFCAEGQAQYQAMEAQQAQQAQAQVAQQSQAAQQQTISGPVMTR
ncbi:hypothetical protein GCM10009552_29150 [Rothia nasimurium]|uniref:Calpain catalytic domain-containing protein n=1 Tax=Luteibacter anthropi TaxID=564369 RepID=A0A7X5UAR7_9GAMM|nr:C2 family cysteine protease [Luteibacter anthropi]NII06894.1 hypothetical protein [Luteibacter anthropi]